MIKVNSYLLGIFIIFFVRTHTKQSGLHAYGAPCRVTVTQRPHYSSAESFSLQPAHRGQPLAGYVLAVRYITASSKHSSFKNVNRPGRSARIFGASRSSAIMTP